MKKLIIYDNGESLIVNDVLINFNDKKVVQEIDVDKMSDSEIDKLQKELTNV